MMSKPDACHYHRHQTTYLSVAYSITMDTRVFPVPWKVRLTQLALCQLPSHEASQLREREHSFTHTNVNVIIRGWFRIETTVLCNWYLHAYDYGYASAMEDSMVICCTSQCKVHPLFGCTHACGCMEVLDLDSLLKLLVSTQLHLVPSRQSHRLRLQIQLDRPPVYHLVPIATPLPTLPCSNGQIAIGSYSAPGAIPRGTFLINWDEAMYTLTT